MRLTREGEAALQFIRVMVKVPILYGNFAVSNVDQAEAGRFAAFARTAAGAALD